ncbi:MAG: PilZ domain-containing protein [Gammaproteobacteria bacterium]|nr:PilZ domain-containing protein [Gammaproteobacteria bacterium]
MSQDEQDFAEKRDFIRMFINAPVDFSIMGSDNWSKGIGKNLSGGGITFSSEQALSEGDNIDIKLHPITPVTPPLEVTGVVARCEKDDAAGYIISTKIEKIIS